MCDLIGVDVKHTELVGLKLAALQYLLATTAHDADARDMLMTIMGFLAPRIASGITRGLACPAAKRTAGDGILHR